MRKRRTLGLAMLIVLVLSSMSLLSSFRVEVGKASNASSVTVYIICLSGVGGTTVNGQTYDPTQTMNGAIAACQYDSVEGKYLPIVHPAYGTTPPFYNINYQVVTDWATYESVITSGTDCIVVNTHGQIIPVPTGYTDTAWVQEIGEAMLHRGVTWVQTGGYPFSQVWYQGSTSVSTTNWAPGGFQTLMALIGLGSATCDPYNGEYTDICSLAPPASSTLCPAIGGWDFTYLQQAQLGCPLNLTVFKDYVTMPLWEKAYPDGNTYMAGAVIAFAAVNQRFGQNQHSFGAYVHIGTDQTFGMSGQLAIPSNEYERGYAGTAAAIWNEVQAFPLVSNSEEDRSSNSDPNTILAATVAPVITSISYNNVGGGTGSYYDVIVCYGILGMMNTSDTSEQISSIDFSLSCPNDSQVELEASNGASMIGEYVQGEQQLSGLGSAAGTALNIANTAQYLLALVYTTGIAASILTGVGGVLLLAGWIPLGSQSSSSNSGIDAFSPSIYLEYTPSSNYVYSVKENDYIYSEVESFLVVDLRVPANTCTGTFDRDAWSMLPLDWSVGVWDNTGNIGALASGESSICLYQPPKNNPCYTTAYLSDFENGVSSGWIVTDDSQATAISPASNACWGIYNGMMYCAGVGTCSSYLSNPLCTSVWPFGCYDNNMNTSLTLPLNTFLSGYQKFELCFELAYQFNPYLSGDFMSVDYLTSTGSWSQLCEFNCNSKYNSYTANWGALDPYYYEFNNIPSTAQAIRFRFYSVDNQNDRGGVWSDDFGVYLYNVEIRGILPQYNLYIGVSPSVSDGTTIPLAPSASYQKYNGSWCYITAVPTAPYLFGYWTLNTVNIITGSTIMISWTQNNNLVAYFYIPTSPPPGHGGGCPYVYDWNGSVYAKDNNILPASENGNGTVTKDYYLLQQPLVPLFSTKQKSVYSLQIGEFENSTDFINQVQLIAVDHSEGTGIAVTQQGQIIAYNNLASPKSCVDNNGNSELAQIDSMNGNVSDPSTYYQGNKSDWLLLDFGRVTGPYANLVLRDDMKCAECIDVQVPNATGGWQTIDVLNPRDYWSMEAVNMAAYIPKTGDFIIRLLWTQTHRLDYVGLDTSPPAPVEVSTASPTLAIHSTMGDVTAKLMYDDTQYVELVNGQYITIWFTLPSQPHDTTRSFILYTDGYYYTITS